MSQYRGRRFQTNDHTIFGQNGAAGAVHFRTEDNGALSAFRPGFMNAQTHPSTLQTGMWQHVVYTRDGTSSGVQKLYVDGMSMDLAIEATNTFSDVTDTKYIGVRDGSQNEFNGQIDDIRIYNRALSPGEVAHLYRIGRPTIKRALLDDGLVGYWNFDQGKGGYDCV